MSNEITREFYLQKIEELKQKYPDFYLAEEIKVLNLILKREYAEEILAGTKRVEFRAMSDHYINRLIDKKALKFTNAHLDDDDVVDFCNPIRPVRQIHFYNYNNSWFLDVEVIEN